MILPPQEERTTVIAGEMLFAGDDTQDRRVLVRPPLPIAFSGYFLLLNSLFPLFEAFKSIVHNIPPH